MTHLDAAVHVAHAHADGAAQTQAPGLSGREGGSWQLIFRQRGRQQHTRHDPCSSPSRVPARHPGYPHARLTCGAWILARCHCCRKLGSLGVKTFAGGAAAASRTRWSSSASSTPARSRGGRAGQKKAWRRRWWQSECLTRSAGSAPCPAHLAVCAVLPAWQLSVRRQSRCRGVRPWGPGCRHPAGRVPLLPVRLRARRR